jgi:hypothetical protein
VTRARRNARRQRPPGYQKSTRSDAPPTVADIGAASATLARPLERPASGARARSRLRSIDPRAAQQTRCRETVDASATRARRSRTLTNKDDRLVDAAHDRGQRESAAPVGARLVTEGASTHLYILCAAESAGW